MNRGADVVHGDMLGVVEPVPDLDNLAAHDEVEVALEILELVVDEVLDVLIAIDG